MRALMAMLAVFAMTSCATTTAPVASVSPASAAPTALSPATASPSPAWSGPVCTLPVMLWSDIGQESQPGFIATSTGVFTADPKGAAALHGQSGSYDAALRAWVPVPREHVSPDGSQYSYTSIQPGPSQGVHLVDVRSGADHVIPGSQGDPDSRGFHYWVVAFQPEGIYVSFISQIASRGLLLMNPVSGSATQVSTDTDAAGAGIFVSGRQAWWTGNPNATPPDPSVYDQPLTGVAGQHAESWFSRDGYTPYVLGAAADGHAIVDVHAFAGDELWVLATPNISRMVGSAPDLSGNATVVPFRTAVEDTSGWWIGGKNGVYFTAGSTMQTVSSTPAIVVGACQAS